MNLVRRSNNVWLDGTRRITRQKRKWRYLRNEEQAGLSLPLSIHECPLEDDILTLVHDTPRSVTPATLPVALVDIAIQVLHAAKTMAFVAMKVSCVNLTVGVVLSSLSVAHSLHGRMQWWVGERFCCMGRT
jgi:hypothetical protein